MAAPRKGRRSGAVLVHPLAGVSGAALSALRFSSGDISMTTVSLSPRQRAIIWTGIACLAAACLFVPWKAGNPGFSVGYGFLFLPPSEYRARGESVDGTRLLIEVTLIVVVTAAAVLLTEQSRPPAGRHGDSSSSTESLRTQPEAMDTSRPSPSGAPGTDEVCEQQSPVQVVDTRPNKDSPGTVVASLATPWPRFFARTFDVWWEVLAVSSVIGLVLGACVPNLLTQVLSWADGGVISRVLWGSACLPLVLIVDAVIYGIAGNTPGKALLALRVTSQTDKRLGFREYLARNFSLWTRGYALGCPILNLCTMGNQYDRVYTGRPASYDDAPGYRVCAGSPNRMRKAAFGVVFVGLLAVMAVVRALDDSARNRGSLSGLRASSSDARTQVSDVGATKKPAEARGEWDDALDSILDPSRTATKPAPGAQAPSPMTDSSGEGHSLNDERDRRQSHTSAWPPAGERSDPDGAVDVNAAGSWTPDDVENAAHFLRALKHWQEAYSYCARKTGAGGNPWAIPPLERSAYADLVGRANLEAKLVRRDVLARMHPDLPMAFNDFVRVTGYLAANITARRADPAAATASRRWWDWWRANSRNVLIPEGARQ